MPGSRAQNTVIYGARRWTSLLQEAVEGSALVPFRETGVAPGRLDECAQSLEIGDAAQGACWQSGFRLL
jgi:hypothetical protein